MAGRAPVLFVCDHASARLPQALGTLGLDDGELSRHIAIDIGAAALTRALALEFGAPALLTGYSRLVIDCNREPADHTSIREISEGVVIPGNRRLTPGQRNARIGEVFHPYHAAVGARLAAIEAAGAAPVLLAVHSFTPRFRGIARPWHAGILSGRDRRIADPMLAALSADASLVVGDNQPYSGLHFAGYTMDSHAVRRGLPCVMIEVRQDLVADDAGVERWAGILRRALAPILAAPFSQENPPARR
ncbi:MAG: N-formylglutamate amidohydrolase [Alphaproteobacteria bacterium]|nr:N-formylglutamate amidohydrolase [Alphaproteobacteria bacterium]